MEGGILAQSLSTLPAHAGASTGNGAMGPQGEAVVDQENFLFTSRCLLIETS